MDPRTEVYNDLSPYFEYLSDNFYIVSSVTKDNHNRVRAMRIYQNCVACNDQRFSIDQMSLKKLKDVNVIHCGKCSSNFLTLQMEKYFPSTFKSGEHRQVFEEQFDTFLYGTQEENCRDSLVLAKYKEQAIENIMNSKRLVPLSTDEFNRRMEMINRWSHIPGTEVNAQKIEVENHAEVEAIDSLNNNNAAEMQVYVRTLEGKVICISVNSSETILDFKNKLKEKNIQFDKVIFSGRVLEDKKTFADYKIQKESAIYVFKSVNGD